MSCVKLDDGPGVSKEVPQNSGANRKIPDKEFVKAKNLNFIPDPTQCAITIQHQTLITHAVVGNFLSPFEMCFAFARGNAVEIAEVVPELQQLQTVHIINVFGSICNMGTLTFWDQIFLQNDRTCRIRKNAIVVTTEEGKLIILKHHSISNFSSRVLGQQITNEHYFEKIVYAFSEPGCNAEFPGHFMATDPRGHAVLIGAYIENLYLYLKDACKGGDKLKNLKLIIVEYTGYMIHDIIGLQSDKNFLEFAIIRSKYELEKPCYEVDVMSFDKRRKFKHTVREIGYKAEKLVPVWPSAFLTSGFLIFGKHTIEYRSLDQKRSARIEFKGNETQDNHLVLAVPFPNNIILAQSLKGQFYVIQVFKVENKREKVIHRIGIQQVYNRMGGVFPPASCLCRMTVDNITYLFLSSAVSDHELFQINFPTTSDAVKDKNMLEKEIKNNMATKVKHRKTKVKKKKVDKDRKAKVEDNIDKNRKTKDEEKVKGAKEIKKEDKMCEDKKTEDKEKVNEDKVIEEKEAEKEDDKMNEDKETKVGEKVNENKVTEKDDNKMDEDEETKIEKKVNDDKETEKESEEIDEDRETKVEGKVKEDNEAGKEDNNMDEDRETKNEGKVNENKETEKEENKIDEDRETKFAGKVNDNKETEKESEKIEEDRETKVAEKVNENENEKEDNKMDEDRESKVEGKVKEDNVNGKEDNNIDEDRETKNEEKVNENKETEKEDNKIDEDRETKVTGKVNENKETEKEVNKMYEDRETKVEEKVNETEKEDNKMDEDRESKVEGKVDEDNETEKEDNKMDEDRETKVEGKVNEDNKSEKMDNNMGENRKTKVEKKVNENKETEEEDNKIDEDKETKIEKKVNGDKETEKESDKIDEDRETKVEGKVNEDNETEKEDNKMDQDRETKVEGKVNVDNKSEKFDNIMDEDRETKVEEKVNENEETKKEDNKIDEDRETKVEGNVNKDKEIEKEDYKIDEDRETKVDGNVNENKETEKDNKMDEDRESKVEEKVNEDDESEKINNNMDEDRETKVEKKVNENKETKKEDKIDEDRETKVEGKVNEDKEIEKLDNNMDDDKETKIEKKVNEDKEAEIEGDKLDEDSETENEEGNVEEYVKMLIEDIEIKCEKFVAKQIHEFHNYSLMKEDKETDDDKMEVEEETANEDEVDEDMEIEYADDKVEPNKETKDEDKVQAHQKTENKDKMEENIETKDETDRKKKHEEAMKTEEKNNVDKETKIGSNIDGHKNNVTETKEAEDKSNLKEDKDIKHENNVDNDRRTEANCVVYNYGTEDTEDENLEQKEFMQQLQTLPNYSPLLDFEVGDLFHRDRSQVYVVGGKRDYSYLRVLSFGCQVIRDKDMTWELESDDDEEDDSSVEGDKSPKEDGTTTEDSSSDESIVSSEDSSNSEGDECSLPEIECPINPWVCYWNTQVGLLKEDEVLLFVSEENDKTKIYVFNYSKEYKAISPLKNSINPHPFVTNLNTLLCVEMGESILQVVTNFYQLVSARGVTFYTSPESRIIACAANGYNVVIYTEDKCLQYLWFDWEDKEDNKPSVHSTFLKRPISLLAVGKIRRRVTSPVIAALESETNRLKLMCFVFLDGQEVKTHKLKSWRFLKTVSSFEILSINPSGVQDDFYQSNEEYLIIGFQDGDMTQYKLDGCGIPHEETTDHLSVDAITMSKVTLFNQDAVIIKGREHHILYYYQGRLQLAPLVSDIFYDFYVPIAQVGYENCLLGCINNELHLVSLPLTYRDMVGETKIQLTRPPCCLTLDEEERKIFVLEREKISVKFPTLSPVTNDKRISQWYSQVEIINSDDFEDRCFIPLEYSTYALSVCVPQEYPEKGTYVIIGALLEFEKVQEKSGVPVALVYEVSYLSEEEPELLETYELEGMPRAMCSFEQFVLIAEGSCLGLYTMSKKRLDLRNKVKLCDGISCLSVNLYFNVICVGHLRNHVSIIRICGGKTIYLYAAEHSLRPTVSVVCLKEDTFASVDYFGNLTMLYLDSDKRKVEHLNMASMDQYHHQELVMKPKFNLGKVVKLQLLQLHENCRPILFYMTHYGALGLIFDNCKISENFFSELQNSMVNNTVSFSGGAEADHLFRKDGCKEDERELHMLQTMIEGDLCLEYLTAPTLFQKAVAKRMGRPPEYIIDGLTDSKSIYYLWPR